MDSEARNETRRTNLLNYAREWRAAHQRPSGKPASEAEFCREHDLSTALLYQIKSKRRGVGDETAHKVEKHAKKPKGWLDRPRGDVQAMAQHLAQLLAKAGPELQGEIWGYIDYVEHRIENKPPPGTITSPADFYTPPVDPNK